MRIDQDIPKKTLQWRTDPHWSGDLRFDKYSESQIAEAVWCYTVWIPAH